MKITLEKLIKSNACSEGIEYFKENYLAIDHEQLTNELIAKEKLNWANWLISKLLNKDNCVRYAIYSAELVLHLFENIRKEDDRPKKAIEAAKNYLDNQCEENRDAAGDAAWAAGDAGAAAGDAAWAAGAAAGDAGDAAGDAAWAAAWAAGAAGAAGDARNLTLTKIINYGLELLKNQESNND